MKTIDDYLNETHEIGYVKKVVNVIAYAHGLPSVRPGEIVIFENGETGRVMSLTPDTVEIITFSRKPVKVAQKVARTGKALEIPLGKELLGKVINPFGTALDNNSVIKKSKVTRPIKILP